MSDGHGVMENRIVVVDGGSFGPTVLESGGRVAVEFMSYGCGHCRAIEPALRKVAEMIWRDERIVRVDVTADPDLANAYGIGGTPTFIMFLAGEELARSEGPEPTIESVLDVVTGPFLA